MGVYVELRSRCKDRYDLTEEDKVNLNTIFRDVCFVDFFKTVEGMKWSFPDEDRKAFVIEATADECVLINLIFDYLRFPFKSKVLEVGSDKITVSYTLYYAHPDCEKNIREILKGIEEKIPHINLCSDSAEQKLAVIDFMIGNIKERKRKGTLSCFRKWGEEPITTKTKGKV